MGALLSILGRVPLTWWALAALLTWGGWHRLQAVHLRGEADRAAASAQQQAAAARAEKQAREFEHAAAVRNQEIADAYAKQRRADTAAAAGARAELDRLRDALAGAAAPGPAASGATAGGGIDGAAGARIVVGQCAATALAVAEAADACESRLSGLQEWARSVAPVKPASAP